MADQLTEFGPGVVAKLSEFVSAVGQQRAFLVTDPGVRAAGIVDRVTQSLDLEYGTYDQVEPNPSTRCVDAGAWAARSFGSAAVIAVGGGSVLDAAKGIALLAGNPGRSATDADALWDGADGLPLIAVPTTSGTGAETNGFGVIEDPDARRKVYIGHSSVKPRIAVLDPELTLGLPQKTTAATGIDALVHGVESLASRSANAVSQAYATQAVNLVSRWLPVAYDDGSDLEARAQLMLGAHLAGQALTISGLGLIHGFAHAITAFSGTPHGIALAAVLAPVVDFGTYQFGADVRAIADSVDLVLPLRSLEIERDVLPAIAATALADPVTRNSPHIPDQTEALELLSSVY
jgi:alcohol dehydrogenase